MSNLQIQDLSFLYNTFLSLDCGRCGGMGGADTGTQEGVGEMDDVYHRLWRGVSAGVVFHQPCAAHVPRRGAVPIRDRGYALQGGGGGDDRVPHTAAAGAADAWGGAWPQPLPQLRDGPPRTPHTPHHGAYDRAVRARLS